MGHPDTSSRRGSERSAKLPVTVRRSTYSQVELPTPAITIQIDAADRPDREDGAFVAAEIDGGDRAPSSAVQGEPRRAFEALADGPAIRPQRVDSDPSADRRWDRVVDQDPVLRQIAALRSIVRDLKHEVDEVADGSVPSHGLDDSGASANSPPKSSVVRPLSARSGLGSFAVAGAPRVITPATRSPERAALSIARGAEPVAIESDETAAIEPTRIAPRRTSLTSDSATTDLHRADAPTFSIAAAETGDEPESEPASPADRGDSTWSRRTRDGDWWLTVAWQGTAALAIVAIVLLTHHWMTQEPPAPVSGMPVDGRATEVGAIPSVIDASTQPPTARIVGLLPSDGGERTEESTDYVGPLNALAAESAAPSDRTSDSGSRIATAPQQRFDDSPLENRSAAPNASPGARR